MHFYSGVDSEEVVTEMKPEQRACATIEAAALNEAHYG